MSPILSALMDMLSPGKSAAQRANEISELQLIDYEPRNVFDLTGMLMFAFTALGIKVLISSSGKSLVLLIPNEEYGKEELVIIRELFHPEENDHYFEDGLLREFMGDLEKVLGPEIAGSLEFEAMSCCPTHSGHIKVCADKVNVDMLKDISRGRRWFDEKNSDEHATGAQQEQQQEHTTNPAQAPMESAPMRQVPVDEEPRKTTASEVQA
jgi:hypothetical protein